MADQAEIPLPGAAGRNRQTPGRIRDRQSTRPAHRTARADQARRSGVPARRCRRPRRRTALPGDDPDDSRRVASAGTRGPVHPADAGPAVAVGVRPGHPQPRLRAPLPEGTPRIRRPHPGQRRRSRTDAGSARPHRHPDRRARVRQQRLRRCVFAAPLGLASERPPLATSSRPRRPLGREPGRERTMLGLASLETGSRAGVGAWGGGRTTRGSAPHGGRMGRPRRGSPVS